MAKDAEQVNARAQAPEGIVTPLRLMRSSDTFQSGERLCEVRSSLTDAAITVDRLPEDRPLSLRGLRWKVRMALDAAEQAIEALEAASAVSIEQVSADRRLSNRAPSPGEVLYARRSTSQLKSMAAPPRPLPRTFGIQRSSTSRTEEGGSRP